MPQPRPRVASLLPSATEMVALVGRAEDLVGISHECDFPTDLPELPRLTRTRASFPRGSAEIDRGVRELVADFLAVYEIDVDALDRAAPDVIVTQDLCDVCAVSYQDVCEAARELARPDLEIVSLRPTVLADIWEDVRRVGLALGAEAEAERALEPLLERVAGVRRRAAELTTRPEVLTIEWLDPVMVGGTWMPELVELAGGEPLVTRAGDHAPTLDVAQLSALEPEVVLFKPCGFPLERTFQERELIEDLVRRCDWPASRSGRIFVADGNAYFNRPGPRITDSLEILAACVHPEAFADLAERHAAGFRRL